MRHDALFTEIRSFAREVIHEFIEDDCPTMAAALAYYTVFSLAPLVVIVIGIAGLFVDSESATVAVDRQLRGVIGPDGADQVAVMMGHVLSGQTGGLGARIVGGAIVLLGVSGVMVQLQSALNRVWEVVPEPDTSRFRSFILKRLVSLAMILVFSSLLLLSLLMTALLTAIADRASALLPYGLSAVSLEVIHFGASLVLMTLLFGAIYKIVPDTRIRWCDVVVGAFSGSLLFSLGKILIGIYLGNSNIDTAYGAASSFALLLVWVYYSSFILLLGAEFTQVWARRSFGGSSPRPYEFNSRSR